MLALSEIAVLAEIERLPRRERLELIRSVCCELLGEIRQSRPYPGQVAETVRGLSFKDLVDRALRGETEAVLCGRRVLEAEGRAVLKAAAELGPDFEQAVHTVFHCRGRIVCTGMGKSGHVARKIAATLASTGTPALFLHAAEAAHGDLGMLTADDAVLALSLSGETEELRPLVEHVEYLGGDLIAIVGRRDSWLDLCAAVSLVLPQAPEACPHGLAPTTSSTVMLALGDALAIAVAERRGLAREDFLALHPGGALRRETVPAIRAA